MGYRWYDAKAIEPLFPFGFGLSYTEFKYSHLQTTVQADQVRLTFDITNSGGRDGAEVAQIYVGEAGAPVLRPPKELKEFAKVTLKVGETKTVAKSLPLRAFAHYDVGTHAWVVDHGNYQIAVGSSSRDLRQEAVITLGGRTLP